MRDLMPSICLLALVSTLCHCPADADEEDLLGSWSRKDDGNIMLTFEGASDLTGAVFIIVDFADGSGFRCTWSASESTISTNCSPPVFFWPECCPEAGMDPEQTYEFGYTIDGTTLTITQPDEGEVVFVRVPTAVQRRSWGVIKNTVRR